MAAATLKGYWWGCTRPAPPGTVNEAAVAWTENQSPCLTRLIDPKQSTPAHRSETVAEGLQDQRGPTTQLVPVAVPAALDLRRMFRGGAPSQSRE